MTSHEKLERNLSASIMSHSMVFFNHCTPWPPSWGISMRKIEKDVRFWGMCDDRLKCATCPKKMWWVGHPSCWCPLSFWVVKAKETKKLCGWSGYLVSIQCGVQHHDPVTFTDVTHCSDFLAWLFCVEQVLIAASWLQKEYSLMGWWWVPVQKVWAGYPSRTLQAEDFGVLGIFRAVAKVSEILFDAPEVGSTHLSNRNLPRMLARRDMGSECERNLFLSQMEGILATRTVAVFGIFHQRLTRCWLGTQRVGERSSDVPHGGLDIRWRYWNSWNIGIHPS